jgi:hypothetical protein
MADKMRYIRGARAELWLKKTGTVAISVGDIVQKVGSNGRVMRVSTTTQYTSAVGVAMQASPTTDPTATMILVYQFGFGTVFEFDLASGSQSVAFKFGQLFTLTSSQPQQLTKRGTAGSNINTSGTTAIAVCAHELEASGSTVKVTFLGSKNNQTVI